jgi:ABC-type phosphate/phosphonate transport system substrate-binding protein
MERPITVGAVAYAARAVPIWEGMRDYFREVGPATDYILFSHYERQVEALLSGQIDIAWNTNVAWIEVERRTGGACRALAMRDVDARYTTVFVARRDSGIRTLTDLRHRRLALGSADSAQAAILPMYWVEQAGIDPRRECTLLRFDLDVGKHGDTGTSELEVLRALRDGEADAGALGISTWEGQVQQGNVDTTQVQPIWTSPGYCHCNFTVLAGFSEVKGRAWTESLLRMRYDDPRWRPLMDMEGLKKWIAADPATMEGYQVLREAVGRQGKA